MSLDKKARRYEVLFRLNLAIFFVNVWMAFLFLEAGLKSAAIVSLLTMACAAVGALANYLLMEKPKP